METNVDIQSLLGDDAEALLTHESKTIARDELTTPGPDYIDRVMVGSDRSPQVLRNPAFNKDGVDYHVSADLTGQANHIGVTIEADIIKQKLPENNGGYLSLIHI